MQNVRTAKNMNGVRKRATLTVREAHYAWSQKSHTDGTFTLAHARGGRIKGAHRDQTSLSAALGVHYQRAQAPGGQSKGMSEQSDVKAKRCQSPWMSKQRDVKAKGCQSKGMSEKRDVRAKGCQSKGMSEQKDVRAKG